MCICSSHALTNRTIAREREINECRDEHVVNRKLVDLYVRVLLSNEKNRIKSFFGCIFKKTTKREIYIVTRLTWKLQAKEYFILFDRKKKKIFFFRMKSVATSARSYNLLLFIFCFYYFILCSLLLAALWVLNVHRTREQANTMCAHHPSLT